MNKVFLIAIIVTAITLGCGGRGSGDKPISEAEAILRAQIFARTIGIGYTGTSCLPFGNMWACDLMQVGGGFVPLQC